MCCGGKILATINGEQGGKNILVEMLRKYFHTIAFLNKQQVRTDCTLLVTNNEFINFKYMSMGLKAS